MKRLSKFIFFLFFSIPLLTQAQTYPEVWFENSILPIRYSNSQVSYDGNSWIKNIKHQLPVSDSVFFTPKNALELQYTSGTEGSWKVDIFYPGKRNFALKEDASLNFKIYVQSKTTPFELPAIVALQADTMKSTILSLGKFIKKYETNKWLSIEIPLAELKLGNLEHGIQSIQFLQNTKDGKEHHLFLDQIEILPASYPKSALTSPAVLSSAVGFEKHVNLTWKLPLTPSIRYIKVYRSEDNKQFHPVAIRPVFVKRYSDIVPESGKDYFYKITWVDYKYQESPVSEVLKVKTNLLADSQLIAMVRETGVSYVVDGEEFNSGMQLNSIASQSSIVSVRNTGIGILALIANVRGDFDSKEKLMKRLEKIVSFLEKAENAHGVFPELLNGRTGKAIYPKNQEENLIVNLESTGILMQALLISKEYFNKTSEVERQFRDRVDKIWRAVEWNAFTKEGNPYLYSQWSSQDKLNVAVPLSGLSKMYLYILALASPEYNINLDSYSKVLQNPLQSREEQLRRDEDFSVSEESESSIHQGREQDGEELEDVENVEKESISMLKHKEVQYVPKSYINGETYYGLPLAVGNVDDSVKDLLIGFTGLNPQGKRDQFADYGEYMKNLIKIQHRKSLEQGDEFFAGKLFPLRNVAIFPFEQKLAIQNMKKYYLNHTAELWNEYGFVREIDLKQNRIVHSGDNLENALLVVMIENGQSGLIWQLFAQDPGISEVLKAVFKK